jgi:O-antigen/teichoic acid export membrane protein
LFLNFYGLEIIKVIARKKEYWDSFSIIPFISLGIIFGMLRDLNTIPLQIVKKTGLISKIVIFSAIFSLMLNWLIIPKYGSIGAAISFIFSQFFYFILMTYFAQKNYKINYEFGKIIKMILVGIILFFISLSLANFSLPIRMISKIFLIIAFPVILYFLSFYEKIEIESMKGFWKKWKHLSNIKSNIQELTKGKNL